MQLAISTATILKEGVVEVENSAVNSKSVERAGERAFVLFCFLFVCLFVWVFCFVLFFVFVFLFFVLVLFCFVFFILFCFCYCFVF